MSNVIDTLLSVSHVTGGSSGGGGGGEAVLINKTAIANGTYTASDDNADGYKKFKVMVSNSYAAGDEGKVVSNGALVSQTSDTATSNGTVDTTLINSLTVAVSADDTLGKLMSNTLTSYSIPENVAVGGYLFYGASSLQSVVFPSVLASIGTQSFRGCSGLTNVHIHKINGGSGNSAFAVCSNIATIVVEDNNNKEVGGFSYTAGAGLTHFDVGNFLKLAGSAFKGNTSMTTLILRKTTVPGLDNVNAFENTPFANGGTGGTIYIPKSLYDHLGDGTSSDYKAATNWSTVNGYGTITWAKIEGSAYENAYADGTPIS